MPSGKEYSMRFILESQLGSSFKGSFAQAQKQLLQMQSQIQALSKEQANIAAYQKQQDAVEKTSRKLMDLQKEYNNIQREISETENFSSSLENKLIEKQRAIDNTSVSLTKQTEKLEHYEAALESSGIDTKNLGSESNRLSAELEELRQEQEKVNAEAEDYGDIGTSSITAVGDALIAAGIAKGLKEIYDAYGDCVQLASDFQATMSTVEALSGASVEDMEQLSALAKELGATTKFTATESAEAMTYMAMAGWDAEQMMSGMDGVMQLAAASGEDLAMVSDIVTDNLTAFGLAASDTARFSDVLAAAATNSNTSVSVMGETFKNSAALAGALGYSVEDVAVAIGLMANAGIKGSNAGTALKNVFNGLLEGVTLTSDAFGEVEYSAINADGTMKSFSETLDDLRYYFNQMTGAEQLQNASAIAGQRAMSGFVSILNASEADIQKLTESINNSSGAAQRMADIKLNNLTGQLTLLNSAADAVKTTVGEAYQNELQALAKVGTDILTEINEFLVAHPAALRAFIALVAEVGALVAIYTTYKAIKSGMNVVQALHLALTSKETVATAANTAAVTAETAATGAATTAQVGLNAAMAANPIGLVIAGVSTLAIGLATLVASMGSAEDEAEQLTYASREQYEELQNLNAEYEAACDTYGATSEQARQLHGEMILLEEDFENNKQTLEEFNEQAESHIAAYEELVAQHNEAMKKLDDEEDVVNVLTNRLDELSSQTSRTAEEKIELANVVNLLNQRVPELAIAYNKEADSLSSTADAIREVIKAKLEQQRIDQLSEDAEANILRQIEAESELNEAIKNVTAAQDEYNYLLKHGNELLTEQAKKQVNNGYGGVSRNMSQAQVQALSAAKKKIDEAIKEQERLQKAYDDTVADGKEWEEQLAELDNEIERQRQELREQEEAQKAAAKSAKNFSDALMAVKLGYLDVATASKFFSVNADYLQESADEIDDYKERLESALGAVENGYYSAQEAAEIYGVTVEEMEVASKIDETADSLAELIENYNEVYEAAYESINGQYDLWDKAAVVIPKSIGDINTALETQTSYWSDYNTGLNNLLSRVDDIDGLREIIASFADGSEDSVNAIAGMAAASDDELREMVKNWQEVQKYQQEATDSVAELSIGFSEQYGEMKNELETAVEDLNLSDEAAEAAELTVEAYVEAIRGGTDAAVEEAERLSALVAMALYDTPGVTAPAALLTDNAKLPKGLKSTLDLENTIISAYASGTDSASPGLALVGEYGPEIIMFNGGEKVLTTEETNRLLLNDEDMRQLNDAIAMRALAAENADAVQVASILPVLNALSADSELSGFEYGGDQNIEINISPSFTVEGGKADDIEERLNEFGERLRDEIIDALEEAGIDAKRSAYR